MACQLSPSVSWRETLLIRGGIEHFAWWKAQGFATGRDRREAGVGGRGRSCAKVPSGTIAAAASNPCAVVRVQTLCLSKLSVLVPVPFSIKFPEFWNLTSILYNSPLSIRHSWPVSLTILRPWPYNLQVSFYLRGSSLSITFWSLSQSSPFLLSAFLT